MQIRIGSLVMWNRKGSRDYGCMGLVTSLNERERNYKQMLCFHVKWTDESGTEYDMSDIDDNAIKVVKF
jgi:hypothetical protein